MAGPQGRSLRVTAASVGGDRVLLMLQDVTQARMIEAVRRDFVANASHELKTPAASIRAIAETMGSAAADDPEAIARFAVQMEQEAVRLSRIISDLLDLSRLEGEPAQRTEVRFDRLVADEAERHRGPAEAGGLQLDVRANGPTVVRTVCPSTVSAIERSPSSSRQRSRASSAVSRSSSCSYVSSSRAASPPTTRRAM